MSDRRIASRLAFTSLLCGLIWLELGGMVSAQQVSADEIINALAPPRVTRGLRAPEQPVATYQGALRIDDRLVWSARSMGDSDFKILSRVVLPGTLPQILTGFRLAVTVSLLVVFLAEMVASSSGLGHVMIYALRTLETKDVFSTLIAMSLLAFIADGLVLVLRRRLLVWSE